MQAHPQRVRRKQREFDDASPHPVPERRPHALASGLPEPAPLKLKGKDVWDRAFMTDQILIVVLIFFPQERRIYKMSNIKNNQFWTKFFKTLEKLQVNWNNR